MGHSLTIKCPVTAKLSVRFPDGSRALQKQRGSDATNSDTMAAKKNARISVNFAKSGTRNRLSAGEGAVVTFRKIFFLKVTTVPSPALRRFLVPLLAKLTLLAFFLAAMVSLFAAT